MMSVLTVTTMMAMGGIVIIPPNKGVSGNSVGKPIAFLQSDTTSREDHQAWLSVEPQVRIQNYPAHYGTKEREGFYDIKTATSMTTPQNAQVQYSCPKDGQECEIVVFVYDCSPCPGRKDGLQYYLMVDKHYERTRCAPTFTIEGSNVQHRMTAYVKSIPEDTTETLQIPNDTDFIAFGMSNAERPSCSSFGDQPSCEDTAARCVWNNNQCEVRQCVQQGPFPPGGCNPNTCPVEMVTVSG